MQQHEMKEGVHWRVVRLDETSSTNDAIRRLPLPEQPRDLLVLTADYQTAGRGATGSWESERGSNLLFTVACAPTPLPVSAQFALSEVACLAVRDALGAYVPDVKVKWPNDIYIASRKVCGMLIEHDVAEGHLRHSFLGIGVNVNQRQFVGSAPNPVSLSAILGHEVDARDLLTQHILPCFAHHYERLLAEAAASGFTAQSALHRHYLESLFWADGGEHLFRADGQMFAARLVDVLPDGRLCLNQDGQLRRFGFKEVSFVVSP